MFYFKQIILLLLILITLFLSSGSLFQFALFVFFTYLYLRGQGFLLGDPPVLLFLAIFSFNMRPFLDEYFGLSSFGITNGFFKSDLFNQEILVDAVFYVKLSIFIFLVGLFGQRYKPTKINLIVSRKNYNLYKVCLLFPTITCCVFLIFICFINGGYQYFNSASVDVRMLRMFIPFLTVCLTINLIMYQKKSITIALIITGLGISVFVGARFLGMSPLICYFIYLSILDRRAFSRKLPVIGLCVICFTVFVNFFRARYSVSETVDLSFVLLFFLDEISFTSNLVPMAMEYVAHNDFSYGINYLGAIISVIPKAAFWMRVEEGTFSFSSALGLYYDSTAINEGLGLNGSLLGESYFSFGFLGLGVILLLSIFCKFIYSNVSGNYLLLFFIISSSPYVITSFIFESTIVIRNIFYYSSLPILVYLVFKMAAIKIDRRKFVK
ncbi:O-antigen polysaccharide polymerase Wzy [Vibrio vulnificus]|uniref:O-antigen polysaccharide polymerase Wzy n=1 Tax=Vibrio vulnificus TaxID=672 RepID=UPI003EDABC00